MGNGLTATGETDHDLQSGVGLRCSDDGSREVDVDRDGFLQEDVL